MANRPQTLNARDADDARYMWRMLRMNTAQIAARLNTGRQKRGPNRVTEAQVHNSLKKSDDRS